MIPFIIKKKLVNVPVYKKDNTSFEVYAICRGFQEYCLDSYRIGVDIANSPVTAINGLSLKVDLAWCLDGIIQKIQPTIYPLLNDKWMNNSGEYVSKKMTDPENEGEEIDNPLATFTECDYWLKLMVNVDVNDRYLIEQGFERLDLVQHYWGTIQL